MSALTTEECTQIEPCYHCAKNAYEGSEWAEKTHIEWDGHSWDHMIHCTYCVDGDDDGIGQYVNASGKTKEEAIAAWNELFDDRDETMPLAVRVLGVDVGPGLDPRP